MYVLSTSFYICPTDLLSGAKIHPYLASFAIGRNLVTFCTKTCCTMLQSFHIGQMQIIASRHELHEFGLVCPSFSQIVPTYSFLLSFEVERDASKLNVVKLCQVLILLYSSSSPTSNKPLQVLTKHGLKTLGHLRSAIVKGQI